MIERFQGRAGKECLISHLLTQKIVNGDRELAEDIRSGVKLLELEKNDILINQDHEDNDLYLILTGSMRIEINRRLIVKRPAGTHVGEMALIDDKSKRCATVLANENSILAKLSATRFAKIANRKPILWRRLAIELCERLRYRNSMVRPRNEIPNVFICSSKECLPIANAIKKKLKDHPIAVKVWTDQVFGPMQFTIDDLEREVSLADFAIAVVMGEDVVRSRGQQLRGPRDNVIFELGLFMGQLGRCRTFIVSPHKEKLKMPSDLLGISPLTFNLPPDLADTRQVSLALKPTCETLLGIIREQGPR